MFSRKKQSRQLTTVTIRQSFREKIRDQQITESKKVLRQSYLQFDSQQQPRRVDNLIKNNNQIQPTSYLPNRNYNNANIMGAQNYNQRYFDNPINYMHNPNVRQQAFQNYLVACFNYLKQNQQGAVERNNNNQERERQKYNDCFKKINLPSHQPIKLAEYQDYNNKQLGRDLRNILKLQQQPKIKFKHLNYLVFEQIIGTGTFSKVYLGRDKSKNVYVAVKQLVQLEQNEINVLKSVDSPYIVKIIQSWRNNYTNKYYLVFQLCQGNLREIIQKGISQKQKQKFIDHMIMGIDALFKRNIIHRDLKFENILITKDQIAKIADFGLAKQLGSLQIVQSVRCGTPYTMAPQIFFHQSKYIKPHYSQKCDIWSFAVILHQMLYNKHPFDCKSDQMNRMQRVRINKKYGYFDLIIDKALVKDPNQRIQWKQLKNIYYFKGVPNQINQQPKFKQQPNQKFKHSQQLSLQLKKHNLEPIKVEKQIKGQRDKKIKLYNLPKQQFSFQNIINNQKQIKPQRVERKKQGRQIRQDQISNKRYEDIITMQKLNKTPPSLQPINPIAVKPKKSNSKQKIKVYKQIQINKNHIPQINLQQNRKNAHSGFINRKDISQYQNISEVKELKYKPMVIPEDIFRKCRAEIELKKRNKITSNIIQQNPKNLMETLRQKYHLFKIILILLVVGLIVAVIV